MKRDLKELVRGGELEVSRQGRKNVYRTREDEELR
jgi:hypothetical protein